MENELARELQAASGELLDFAHVGLATSSASPSRAPQQLNGFSESLPAWKYSNAKLELLSSPTDVRPAEWPAPVSPSTRQQSRQPNQLLHEDIVPVGPRPYEDIDEEDDRLPFRGLSGRIESVKAIQSHLSPSFDANLRLHADSREHAQNLPLDAGTVSPSKLRITSPVNDIYINQYGERVVDGKVVGKTIGGRPRQAADTSLSLERASRSSPGFSDTARFDNRGNPPAFFLESFPENLSPNSVSAALPVTSSAIPPLQAPRAVSRAIILAPSDEVPQVLERKSNESKGVTDTLSINEDDVSSGSGSPTYAEDVKNFTDISLLTPVEESSTKGKFPAMQNTMFGLPSLRPPSATLQITRKESDHVTLHGNKRQARVSSGAESSMASERAVSPFLLPILSQRVEKLFTSSREYKTTSVVNSSDADPPKDAQEASASSLNDSAPATAQLSATEELSELTDPNNDAASLESASSSLLSLPVSVPSCRSGTSSLERRRGSDGSKPRRRSRRSDQDSYPDDNFARDVRIRGWNEVGSQARGWVVFEILIVTRQGTPMTILKRFNSFVRLRKELALECPGQQKWLPTLPSKSTGILRKYDAKHLEARRKDLQRWLEVVMLDKVWGCSESLREWVLEAE